METNDEKKKYTIEENLDRIANAAVFSAITLNDIRVLLSGGVQPTQPAGIYCGSQPEGTAVAVPKAAPTKAAPVKDTPVKAAPVKAAPVKEAPVKATPVKAAPVKVAPVKEAEEADNDAIIAYDKFMKTLQRTGGAYIREKLGSTPSKDEIDKLTAVVKDWLWELLAAWADGEKTMEAFQNIDQDNYQDILDEWEEHLANQ